MAIPFPGITGQGQPEVDALDPVDVQEALNGTLPLGQQITLLLDAEIPVSATSAADWSDPLAPTAPITGFHRYRPCPVDLFILDGQQQYPLIDNWFQVPLSDLTSGYNFGNVADPSAGVGPGGSVPGMSFPDGNTFYGTIPTGELTGNGNPVSDHAVVRLGLQDESAGALPELLHPPVGPDRPEHVPQRFRHSDLPGCRPIPGDLPRGVRRLLRPVCSGQPLLPGHLRRAQLPDSPGDSREHERGSPDSSIQQWLDLFNTPSTGPYGLENPFGSANGPTETACQRIQLVRSTIRKASTSANRRRPTRRGRSGPREPSRSGRRCRVSSTRCRQNILPGSISRGQRAAVCRTSSSIWRTQRLHAG